MHRCQSFVVRPVIQLLFIWPKTEFYLGARLICLPSARQERRRKQTWGMMNTSRKCFLSVFQHKTDSQSKQFCLLDHWKWTINQVQQQTVIFRLSKSIFVLWTHASSRLLSANCGRSSLALIVRQSISFTGFLWYHNIKMINDNSITLIIHLVSEN